MVALLGWECSTPDAPPRRRSTDVGFIGVNIVIYVPPTTAFEAAAPVTMPRRQAPAAEQGSFPVQAGPPAAPRAPGWDVSAPDVARRKPAPWTDTYWTLLPTQHPAYVSQVTVLWQSNDPVAAVWRSNDPVTVQWQL